MIFCESPIPILLPVLKLLVYIRVLIQAFHLGVTKRKRSHLSAATFALAVYHRTGIKVAEKKARRVAKRHKERANFFFRESVLKELSVDEDTGNSVTEEVEDLVTDVTKALKRSANVKWVRSLFRSACISVVSRGNILTYRWSWTGSNGKRQGYANGGKSQGNFAGRGPSLPCEEEG